MLRWNQILRELVARYNLPPAPRDNDTYVFPDANNPFADPAFPFANPPYAARAYSYVAVAQFEALKVAWSYKYQYNRPSPVPRRQRRAGPDARRATCRPIPRRTPSLSGVSTELLRLLFPAAVEEITRKAGEQREAALLSGKAAASDIAAGLALGRAVAAVFVARAGTDGMGAAVGTPAQWQALANAAAARGEIPWKSLETPPRPPMLPNFGQVRGLDDDAHRRRRASGPAPPPSTSSAQMQQELAEVKQTVENLTREQMAIAYKWNDGAGTYTPPGHWNDIATEYVRDARFSEVRAARAFALAEHGHARRRGGVLGREVRTTSTLARPSSTPSIKTVDRPAELPGLHLGPLDLLGGGGRGPLLPVPERRLELRRHEGRGGDLPAVRRHPLPRGHRGRQGPRPADRRLHGELRPAGRRGLSARRRRLQRGSGTLVQMPE